MSTPSVKVFRRLEGLFSVYKPQGVHWKLVRDAIETNLLKGINAAPPPAPSHRVKFLVQPKSTKDPRELTITATSVPSLADHPLVTGPEFRHLQVGVGHRLDTFSSGVLVLGVGYGNKALNQLYHSRVTRDYVLEGEFGKATDSFTPTGHVVERTTYDHITRDRLESVLAMMQGANQKALLAYSKVDMRSQEAYELAVRGALYPDEKTPPILLGLRCLHFQPPHFTLEVQCMNETQKYLYKVIHEVGLELRSTAVCRGVRRTRDGLFHVQDALTHKHWTTADVMQAIQQYHASRKTRECSDTHAESNDSPAHTRNSQQVETARAGQEEEGEQGTTVAALH